MELFRLFGTIMVDNERANQSIHKTEDQAESLGHKFLAGAGKAAKWGAAIGAAAVAAGAALFKVGSGAAETLDRIDKMSQKIGVSRQGYQEWEYILSQNGMEIDKLQVGIKSLTTSIGQATDGTGKGAEAFRQLGVSIRDAQGDLKSQEAIFEDTVKALQAYPEGVDKARLANELFGRSGQELMPLLNSAAGSVDELKQRAHELGLIMSDDAITAGVKLQDTIDDVHRAFGSIATRIGIELMPLMQSAADWILAHLPEIQAVMSAFFGAISALVEGFVLLVKAFAAAVSGDFSSLFELLKKIVGAGLEFIGNLVLGALDSILNFLKGLAEAFFEAGRGLLQSFWDGLKQIWENIKSWALDKVSWITDLLGVNVQTEVNTDLDYKDTPHGSHASGLTYVPFDGYRAELHRGERVLTARESREYAQGGGSVVINLNVQMDEVSEVYKLVDVVKRAKQTARAGLVAV